MKRVIATLGICGLFLSGCNKQIIDVNYSYEYAWISLPTGEVVFGEVQSWNDYEGDQIQVKVNGVTYLTDTTRCVLATSNDIKNDKGE